jgi:hypothetical protein
MSTLEDRKTSKEVHILVSSSRSKFIAIWGSFDANKGLFRYSLGDKVKQLLGGAYENGDQMFVISPKGPWKKLGENKDNKGWQRSKHSQTHYKQNKIHHECIATYYIISLLLS